MRRPLAIIGRALAGLLVWAACSGGNEPEAGLLPPMERTQTWMTEIDATDLASIRHMLDEIGQAQRKGLIQDWRADSLRSRIMAQTFFDLDSAVIYSRRTLAYDSIRLVPQRHINELLFLATRLLTLGYASEAITYCMEGATLAEGEGDQTSLLAFETMMGTGLYWMRDKARGLSYLEKSIAGLRPRKSLADRWQLSYAMGQTMDCLEKDNPERAILIGRERETVIQELQAHELLPQDSMRLNIMRGLTFARMAYLHAILGHTAEAKAYEEKYYDTAFAHSTRGRQAILDYYNAAGMHEKLLERFEESKGYWEHKDTICERYNDVLGMLAISYAKLGDYARANDMRQRQMQVTDSILNRESLHEGLRMATLYQVHEKEAELARRQMQNRYYLTLLAVAAAALLVLLLLLNVLRGKNREIRYKNRMLVKYIKRMEDAGEQAARPDTAHAPHEEHLAPQAGQEAALHRLPDMEQHLARLDHLMNHEHVYLDSDFSREKLQRLMGLSKNALTPVLREGLGGRPLTEYVSEKRIAHACTLLAQHPERNVADIALASGFFTQRNFNRVFRELMGMTASEFRRASL